MGSDLAVVAARVGADVAAPGADAVDRDARFPAEAVEALRAERMLSALVPRPLGGAGATVSEVAAAVEALGQHCASTAMVYAMHQIQVACIVRHAEGPFWTDYLTTLADEELLLASATTEAGVGGDVRTSLCAVETDGDRFRLEKQAPVISYGAHSDGVLATARRAPESPPNDQVLVLCRRPGLALTPTSSWDTMGFRGTCSLGFRLLAEGPVEQVLPAPYADISSETMLPVSHILWSSVWLGIAAAAVARARHYVRAEARKKPGTTPPAAGRVAELVAVHQQFTGLVRSAALRYDLASGNPDELRSLSFAVAMNSLKVSSSLLVVDVVTRALQVCGMAGYRHDSPYAMGRLLRDAHGAALMINNDRINSATAQLLLVAKD